MSDAIVRNARLGYEIVLGSVIYDGPLHTAVLLVQPRITGMRMEHADDDLVLDVAKLAASRAASGAEFLLTCSCDYPSDTHIHGPIGFTHADANTVCWHLCARDHAVLFDEVLAPDTRIRLHFDARQYATAIHALIADIAGWLAGPAHVDALRKLPQRSLARGGHALDADVLGNETELEVFFEPMCWDTESGLPEGYSA